MDIIVCVKHVPETVEAEIDIESTGKGIKTEDIEHTCIMAKKAGLEPHITIMVGYPWETKKDAEATITFARKLFSKGYINYQTII